MAGKAPRPNRNSDGQAKQASANPTGGANAAQAPQGPPSLVPPGGPPSIQDLMAANAPPAPAQPAPPVDPNIAQQQQADGQSAQQQMLLAAQQHAQAMQAAQAQQAQSAQEHGQAMQLQTSQQAHEQQMAQLQAQQAQQGPTSGGSGASGSASGSASAPPAPPGAQEGINPSQWPHNMVREGINFKDLPPMGQAQAQEQEGINPAAPLQMIQSQLQSSLAMPGGPQGGPQQGPVPASFSGPMVPPGLEGLPHDLATLTQVMQRGFSPGADNAEHQMGLHAHSMVKAHLAEVQRRGSAPTDSGY